MAATPRSGINAVVMIDTSSAGNTAAVQVFGKAKWSFDQSRDFFDTTEFGATSRSNVPGLPNATGTVEGLWDSADNNVYNIFGASTERALRIYPDFTNNVGSYIYGKAFFSAKSEGGVAQTVNQNLDFTAGPTGLNWAHP